MANVKKERGRPKKINEQVISEFKTFIIAGCSLKEACNQVGITTQTWRNFTKKHPIYLAKFAKWKNELKTRAKLNIALKITNEKDADYSTYYLDYLMKLKDQAARTSLTRARAKQARIQAKIMERQLEQVDNTADKSRDSMAQLDVNTLRRLSHLADGVDNNAD